jgi:hypothetical protein
MTNTSNPDSTQPRIENGTFGFKTPTPPGLGDLTPVSGAPIALFVDEETGEPVTIVQTDDQEFQAQGPDGNITFRAANDSTPQQLAAEAENFWHDDELGERGRGLDSLDQSERDELYNHYAVAALWTATDEEGEPLDAEHAVDDIDEASRQRMTEDLDQFLTSNRGYVDRAIATGFYGSWEQVAHDFWLTRNGHGAGFWDRGLGDLGTKLTDAAKVYGTVDVYAGDNGQLDLR